MIGVVGVSLLTPVVFKPHKLGSTNNGVITGRTLSGLGIFCVSNGSSLGPGFLFIGSSESEEPMSSHQVNI